jgi:Raf kinase inhibitor-like YbhB/YbcL family protein
MAKKVFGKFILSLALLFVLTSSLRTEGGLTLKITSPSFNNNQSIPKKFTCDGKDINPALNFSNIPDNARSLVLIVDDPDAPVGTWTHWVVFNIPIIERIEENSIPGKEAGNDFGRNNYGGPCPPGGTHRYFFKVYALDINLNLEEGVSRSEVEDAMKGHILDSSQLIGLYKR